MEVTTKKQLKVRYRLMQELDIKQILEIEKQCYNIPWTYGMFFQEITLPVSRFYVTYVENNSTNKEEIVGYAGYWIIKEEAHIVNLSVHKDYRHEGIGQGLLNLLIENAKKDKLCEMSLEVRCSNKPAISLYKKNKFIRVAIRPSYYQDNDEDAIIMWRKL